MNKICTSIEQSKKLIELGIDVNTADMCWVLANPDLPMIKAIAYKDSDKNNKYYEILPAWSLAALFDVLPKYIGDYGKCLYNDMWYYYCGYMCDGDFILTIEEGMADNPIDACYEMILNLDEQELL